MRRSRLLTLLLCAVVISAMGMRGAAQSKTLLERPIAEAPSFVKLALVVGVGDYDHAAKLAPHTHRDARAFAQLLRTRFSFPDGAITLMTDEASTPDRLRPTYAHLRSALNSLVNRVTEKTEVIVYFSGHGIRVDDQDWLVPQDGDPADVRGLCINYAEFHNKLETKNPGRALVIVDACRNLENGKGTNGSGFGAGEEFKGPQFAELFSCQPKQTSQLGKAGDFEESVFTHFLLAGLSGDKEAQENGVVTFESLKDYLQGKVSQYVNQNYGGLVQVPVGRSLGKMVLAKGGDGSHFPDSILEPIKTKEREQPDRSARRTLPDGAELVFIPAGEFTMGSNAYEEEKPLHKVYLDSYYIAKTPVTVAQYLAFCAATNHARPTAPDFNANWSKADHPIVNVSWDDAQDYCAWLSQKSGRRVSLPTEAQWEKAARGEDGRRFPWGNMFDESRVQCTNVATGNPGGTAAAGSFLNGASPYGALDMAGNVLQFCADWYDATYYKSSPTRNPLGPASSPVDAHVLRGSAWTFSGSSNFRCASRRKVSTDHRWYGTGFRCVVSE